MQSNTAGDIIREIGYEDVNHPVIQRLLKWYSSKKHFNGKTWKITVESNNDYPHASWWNSQSNSSCHTDYNETAQIVGFIVCYAEKDSELFQFAVKIAKEAIQSFLATSIADMHTYACYMKMADLFEKANVTDFIPFYELKENFHQTIHDLIETDISKWSGYVCLPSCFIQSKDSEYYLENKDIAAYECHHSINTQLADGSWDIAWNWDNYQNEWVISKNWWKDHFNYSKSFVLKRFW